MGLGRCFGLDLGRPGPLGLRHLALRALGAHRRGSLGLGARAAGHYPPTPAAADAPGWAATRLGRPVALAMAAPRHPADAAAGNARCTHPGTQRDRPPSTVDAARPERPAPARTGAATEHRSRTSRAASAGGGPPDAHSHTGAPAPATSATGRGAEPDPADACTGATGAAAAPSA